MPVGSKCTKLLLVGEGYDCSLSGDYPYSVRHCGRRKCSEYE